MFAVLLVGLYTAYKHFSGLDPLKIDPQSVLKNVVGIKSQDQLVALLSGLKLPQALSSRIAKSLPGVSSQPASTQVLGLAAGQAGQSVQINAQQPYVFRFLLVSDSHDDNDNLKKAIIQAKTDYPDTAFIIGLGDYTNVGTIEELMNAKAVFDSSGLRYFLLAGDHDLWDSRNRKLAADTNFKQVFGPLYQAFDYQNFRFLLLDNSDDYIGISDDQQKWILDQLDKLKEKQYAGAFVFIDEPLYHPSSDHFMGRVEPKLKQQAQSLIFQLKSAGVRKIFSGDTHVFGEFEEPVTKLSMVTVGALVTDRNPQVPRFAVVTVFADGSTKVDDVEIK